MLYLVAFRLHTAARRGKECQGDLLVTRRKAYRDRHESVTLGVLGGYGNTARHGEEVLDTFK
ncbi:MAG: hypothetical protein A2X66_05845 [Ignavibacteria bacterium GWA2_54_16]|nr:MAG: hypothetical protein A2X66_05845 [Ignavibacteria bacterium GWA2_54_16]